MKTRISVVMLSMATLLFLVQVSAAQMMGPQPFSADATFSGTAHGSREATEMQGKMYFDRNHMRMEMEAGPRGGMVMISNFQTKVVDMLMPSQQMYFEHRMDENSNMRRPGAPPSIKPFADPSNPCANDEGATCKNLGTETVNGRVCDHWQITSKDGKVTNAWVDKKIHFPIKSVTPDGTWELSNIKEGEPDASLFQIPAGYHKMDMGSMMQGGRPPQQ